MPEIDLVLAVLIRHHARLPGADDRTPLVVVPRTGSTVDGATLLTPDELLDAW
ncbi:MAG TPA: hypothetical protein VGC67_10145 [Cellulomonas sp.]